MQTVIKETIYEETIKNSKFISVIIPFDDNKNLKEELTMIKDKYKNATHYCYAYLLTNSKGFSDDGEPNKTAGLPMLTVLEKDNLVNILVVVIRYFGGIKLGPGGLIRAYTKLVKEGLKKATKATIIEGYELVIKFSYDKEKEINYLLKDSLIIEKNYQDSCIYTINIAKDLLNILKNKVEIIKLKEKLIPVKD